MAVMEERHSEKSKIIHGTLLGHFFGEQKLGENSNKLQKLPVPKLAETHGNDLQR